MEAVATDTLTRNLTALRKGSPDTAARIESARPRPDARISRTEDGGWTVELADPITGGAQALASRRRPLEEAERFADGVDVKKAAILVIAGFGAGHHVRALAERMGRTGMVVVFEPDAGLLRALFERVDCSEWFTRLNVAVLCDPDDGATMAETVRGLEGLVAMGVELIEHPPNRARLGPSAGVFHKRFVELVRTMRMTVTTTLVQVPTTLANATQNIDHYALTGKGGGIEPLAGCCVERPAIVVSAGPSLTACLPLLARPEVRERCLIIAVQTVLKTLLRAGVRPHLVTALDYSEISARFYEGLSERDLEGVTLVVEPKVNPAVTQAFKGRVLCAADPNLDQLLGPELVGTRARLEQGATVAHLAYYLARHCGCDPVGFVGQDLAFTDGAYYGAGASIHNIWACELNEFNTLELLEWLRVVRMAPHLRRAKDALGRDVFTDEQMDTYRVQFERDFRRDADRGLRVFDCAADDGGSGVRKQHAEPLALRTFLDRFANQAGVAGDADQPMSVDALLTRAATKTGSATASKKRVLDRLSHVRSQVWRFGQLSRKAENALTQMLEHHADQERVNRLIADVEKLRRAVVDLEPGAFLVHTLNQSGSLERIRSDRLLQLEMAEAERAAIRRGGKGMDPYEAQRRTIERDLRNVRSLARSADEMGRMLRAAEEALNGAPRRTRRPTLPTPTPLSTTPSADGSTAASAGVDGRTLRAEALVLFDSERTALGFDRTQINPDDSALGLALCVRRLRRIAGLNGVRIVTDAPDAARSLLATGNALLGDGGGSSADSVIIEPLAPQEISRLRGPGMRAVRIARRFGAACWRGAPGGLTAIDEALEPAAMARIMAERGIDAALVAHADWWFIDPDRCAALIERHRADPASHRLVFSQDPPGLVGAVLAQDLMRDIASLRASHTCLDGLELTGAGKFAGLSGALAYVPSAPAMDLIAQPLCVETTPELRDSGLRLSADTPTSARALAELVRTLLAAGVDPATVTAGRIFETARSQPHTAARHTVIRVGRADGRWTPLACIADELRSLLNGGTDLLTVTLAGDRAFDQPSDRLSFDGDPLDHPEGWPALLATVRAAAPQASVHLRTNLLTGDSAVRALASDERSRPDLISVDLLGESASVYQRVGGRDTFGLARRNMETLLTERAGGPASQTPDARAQGSAWWSPPVIVARMTRCDAAYADVETFINRWMSHADWAVLDPLPVGYRGELLGRIAPMPMPAHAQVRLSRDTVLLDPLAGDAPRTHETPACTVQINAAAPRGGARA